MRCTPVLLLLSGLALSGCSGAGAPTAQQTPPVVDATPAAPSTEPTADAPVLPTPSVLPTTAAPTPTRTTQAPPQDPLSPAPALESPAPVGQPTCRPAALTVTDADQVTSSSAAQEIFLLRTKGPACQLDGYPVVRLLDAAGSTLPVTYRHGGFGLPTAGPRPVTLTADTTLSFQVGTARSGTCRSAATLVVTLPGTSSPLRTSTTLSVCGSAAGLTPVQRNADVEGANG